MHSSVEKLKLISTKVNDLINTKQLKTEPNIIVVTKMFSMSSIVPLLESGHIHYGENKVQEAVEKWSQIKKEFKNSIKKKWKQNIELNPIYINNKIIFVQLTGKL